MIKLTIGTTTERKTATVTPETTVRQVLDTHRVSTSGAVIHLNGSLVPEYDFNRSLADLNVPDESEAMLIAVVKASSAR